MLNNDDSTGVAPVVQLNSASQIMGKDNNDSTDSEGDNIEDMYINAPKTTQLNTNKTPSDKQLKRGATDNDSKVAKNTPIYMTDKGDV